MRRRGLLGLLSCSLLSIPVLGPLLLALRVISSPSPSSRPDEVSCLPLHEIPEDGIRFFRLTYRRRVGPFEETIERAVLLRRRGRQVIALSAECTHLGCPVRPGGAMLKCPCHGGTFDLDGKVLDGPPPAPLRRLEAVIPSDPKKPVRLRI